MELDIAIHKGRKDKPAVILIHGLGMDKDIWVDPLGTKIFARNVPLKVFAAAKPKLYKTGKTKKISIGEIPENIHNLWNALKAEEFNLVCWSQKRPVGPVHVAVKELAYITKKVKRLFPNKPIALVGHSRGGLIARKFLEKKIPGINALITIATPHAGSAVARLGKYLKPFSVLLKGRLPKSTHGTISRVIKNISDLLEGNALKELLPDSGFINNLKDAPQHGVHYISFGGNKPGLFTLYVWKRERKKMSPKPLLTIPDSLLKIIPAFIVTDEIVPGRGDGLVTAKSSLLPWASKHYTLPVNHISILWNRDVINTTIAVLQEL